MTPEQIPSGVPQGWARPEIEVAVWLGPGYGRLPAQVVVRDPAATVGDLASQLGVGWSWLALDGQFVGPSVRLTAAGLRRGSLVAVPPGSADPPGSPSGPYIVSETGLDSGRFFPLGLGETVAGSDDRADIALSDGLASARHCTFVVGADGSVTVEDLGSAAGTILNGVPVEQPALLCPGDELLIGSTLFSFWVSAPPPRPTTTRQAGSFHRPPRRKLPAPIGSVDVPAPPRVHEAKPVLPVVALVTPMVFGVAMVFLLHSLIYVAFAFLGPLAALGTYLDGARRHRRARRGDTRAYRAALAQVRTELENQRRQAAERSQLVAGPLAELREQAVAGAPKMWERRAGHPDFLEVRLASGHVPYTPVVSSQGELTDAARQVIEEVGRRGLEIATLRLDNSMVGIWGEREAALCVARSLLLQAATTSGPADLAVELALGPDAQADWSWARWLPHTSTGADESEVPFGAAGTSDQGRRTLWVIDGPVEAERNLVTRMGLAVAEDFNLLPDECTTIVHVVEGGSLSIEELHGGRRTEGLLACGVSADVADAWARRLAVWEDDELPRGRLLELVNGYDLWSGKTASRRLTWLVGQSRVGPVELDMCGPEPHVLIAGAPGSGRTSAVEAAVVAFSVFGPDVVNVAILDLAGGQLSKLAEFPHVCATASELGKPTNPDGPLARLEAEVLRRDELVRGGGCYTLEEYMAAGGTDVAHLVVVVDDPGTLSAEDQSTLEAVVRLVVSSAHLGLHTIFATTQPSGRAARVLHGSAARIALRLDRRSCEELVGVAHPAFIPRSRPGRGWLQTGDQRAMALQLAFAGAPAPPGSPVEVRTEGWGTPSSGPSVAELMARHAAERAPIRARPLWGEAAATGMVQRGPISFASLLGLDDISQFDPAEAWRGCEDLDGPGALSAPIGTDARGEPVWLDLKEAAFGGMGPHGMVVGATGSGKSELLRTLVCSLVARHPPELLSLVLVDFKGGATFSGLGGLPHVAGLITNLEDDLSNVDRMEAALLGEQQRRQELLRRAGHLGSAEEYRQARRKSPQLPALPELLVIVDEFAELLEQRPEFIAMFGSIGRLGRSLGIHLLLATQRLDEGRLRGLESHLRYRVSLRTNSAAESRSVLGLPDAASLPSSPGAGYIRVDEPRLLRFQAAMVSAPPAYPRADGSNCPDIEVVARRVRDAAPVTHQIWLPVLPPTLSLGRLLGKVGPLPGRGLQALDWEGRGAQRVPIGVIDRPRLQNRALLSADFAGATGHMAVVGSPRSGKTTFLWTVAASLALTHTPEEVNIYGLDFAGGNLMAIAGLPHVGGVAHQGDEELTAGVVAHAARLVEQRQAMFREHRIHSLDEWRRMRSAHLLPDGGHADIYLMVDGWDGLRAHSDVLEDRLTELARRGLSAGIHLVITANRWAALRPAIRESILGRRELRQSDPMESLFDRKAAANVPVDRPGRGITEVGEHFLVALPILGVGTGDADTAGEGPDLQQGWRELVSSIGGAWTGPAAQPVQVLPALVAAGDLPAPARGVAVGLCEPDIEPLVLEPHGRDQHVLVLGDSGAGKTSFLRTFLAGITTGRSSEEVKVAIIDPRRQLMDMVGGDLLFGYAGAVAAAGPLAARLREALEQRMPGPEVTVQQLKDRSWWQGPEAYLIVDDHDILVSPSANPLLPVLDLLAQAGDVGFHLVVARRVAGWQRSQYEPVLQRMREVGTTMFVLSGDPAEGLITGTVRAALKPPGRAVMARYRSAPVAVQLAI